MDSVNLNGEGTNGTGKMTTDIRSIASYELKNVKTGQNVKIEEFFTSTCVFIFFRRWGCLLCRVWANELSEMAPILKRHNIRLIGVGCEELGAQEFLSGDFFEGELFVDVNKKLYETLEFRRFNYCSIVTSLLTAESRSMISKGRQLHLGGNFKGDGLQNGGALIVEKGGKLLYEFKQVGPAEHLPNEKILSVLSLDQEIENLPKKDQPAKDVTCDK